MNTLAIGDKLPVAAFEIGPVSEPGIPVERDGKRPTIGEIDDEQPLAETDSLRGREGEISARRSHTRSLTAGLHVASPASRLSAIRRLQIHDSLPRPRDPARTLPPVHPDSRECEAVHPHRLNRRKAGTGRSGRPSAWQHRIRADSVSVNQKSESRTRKKQSW